MSNCNRHYSVSSTLNTCTPLHNILITLTTSFNIAYKMDNMHIQYIIHPHLKDYIQYILNKSYNVTQKNIYIFHAPSIITWNVTCTVSTPSRVTWKIICIFKSPIVEVCTACTPAQCCQAIFFKSKKFRNYVLWIFEFELNLKSQLSTFNIEWMCNTVGTSAFGTVHDGTNCQFVIWFPTHNPIQITHRVTKVVMYRINKLLDTSKKLLQS